MKGWDYVDVAKYIGYMCMRYALESTHEASHNATIEELGKGPGDKTRTFWHCLVYIVQRISVMYMY